MPSERLPLGEAKEMEPLKCSRGSRLLVACNQHKTRHSGNPTNFAFPSVPPSLVAAPLLQGATHTHTPKRRERIESVVPCRRARRCVHHTARRRRSLRDRRMPTQWGRHGAARALVNRTRAILRLLASDPEAQADIRCTQRKERLRVWKFRHHPLIVEVLELWWQVPCNSFSDDETGGPLRRLSKEQYKTILRKLAKALVVPEDYDPEAVEEQAEEDWLDDNHGSTHLREELFKDAMFELCDVWTRDDTPELYAEFLRQLLRRRRRRRPPRFKHDHEISYGGYIADDEWDALQNDPPPAVDFAAALESLDDGKKDKKGKSKSPKKNRGPDEAALLNDLAIAEKVLGEKEVEREKQAKLQAVQDKKDAEKRKQDARGARGQAAAAGGERRQEDAVAAEAEAAAAAAAAAAAGDRGGAARGGRPPPRRQVDLHPQQPRHRRAAGARSARSRSSRRAASDLRPPTWLEDKFGQDDYLAGQRRRRADADAQLERDAARLAPRRAAGDVGLSAADTSWCSTCAATAKPRTPGTPSALNLGWGDFRDARARAVTSREKTPPPERPPEDELFPPRPDTASSRTSLEPDAESSRPTTLDGAAGPAAPREHQTGSHSEALRACCRRARRAWAATPPQAPGLRPRTDLGGSHFDLVTEPFADARRGRRSRRCRRPSGRSTSRHPRPARHRRAAVGRPHRRPPREAAHGSGGREWRPWTGKVLASGGGGGGGGASRYQTRRARCRRRRRPRRTSRRSRASVRTESSYSARASSTSSMR